MKREHGRDDDRKFPNKRQRNDGFMEAISNGKFELRLLVSSKSAGAIIGKGGDNIKRLRSEFDAHIQVPDSNSPERIINVTADPGVMLDIMKDILPRLEDAQTDKDACEVRVLIHQSHAGALIGRSGSKIKELREKCGARMKIFQHCAPGSTDRVLLTSGDLSSCLKMIENVMAELKEIPIKGPSTPYNPNNYENNRAHDYGGFEGSMSGPPRSMGKGGPPPRSGGYGYSDGRGLGDYGYRGGPPQGYQAGTYGSAGYGGPPPPPANGYYGGVGGYGTGNQTLTTAQVTIPSNLGGTIIGKGGERIARIRQESGAQITLEAAQGQPERIITITGTEHQIHTAQYLLQQCVRTSHEGREQFGPM
ncbi:unnamed protein product [Caenorhabditis bovis]|uniref:K Homology domain-containing protein n=1 Tax=Caenorhabditis bovis TaxID=2654633 RepID=A0A8S1F4M8_9PELO|nr:unnamed protein product [Caenorhabditis bovis]